MEALKVDKKDPDGFKGNIIANNKHPKPNNILASFVDLFFIENNFKAMPKSKLRKNTPPIRPYSAKNSIK